MGRLRHGPRHRSERTLAHRLRQRQRLLLLALSRVFAAVLPWIRRGLRRTGEVAVNPESRMPLKAIAFDLWETLITDTPEISRAQERLRMTRMESVLGSRGHAAEAEQIERAYRRLWHRCHDLYWSEDLDVPCRRQIEIFLEELGVDEKALDEATLDELERVYANAAVEHLPAAVAGAKQALQEVARRGYRVGLISNTGRTPGYALREILSRLELAPHIDAMVFSNEHGACKPQPSIFEELRASLGVEYCEMLFIGDNLHV